MRTVIKKDRVHLIESDQPATAEAKRTAAPNHRAERAARLVEIDGEVRAIEFRCSCGEVSLIELEYGPSPEANQ